MSQTKRAVNNSKFADLAHMDAIKKIEALVNERKIAANETIGQKIVVTQNNAPKNLHAFTTKIIFHAETGMYEIATYFYENVLDQTHTPTVMTQTFIPLMPSANECMQLEEERHASCCDCAKSKAEKYAERHVCNGSLYDTPATVKMNGVHHLPSTRKS